MLLFWKRAPRKSCSCCCSGAQLFWGEQPAFSSIISHSFVVWRRSGPSRASVSLSTSFSDRRCSRSSRAVCVLTRGWSCQHHNKSPWLSRPCSSRWSSCRGCSASAAGPGRRRVDLTLATPEKVGHVAFVCRGGDYTQQHGSRSCARKHMCHLASSALVRFSYSVHWQHKCPDRRLHTCINPLLNGW